MPALQVYNQPTSYPRPRNQETAERWDHTRLRRRILYGKWGADLEERMRELVGTVRKEAWGRADKAANPFKALCSQLATLYDRAPGLGNREDATGGAAEVLRDALADAGLWSFMQRIQRDTLGMREMVVRVDTTDEGELTFLPAYPDTVNITMDPRRPGRIIRYEELQERHTDPDDLSSDTAWVWEVIEVVDGREPSQRFVLDHQGSPALDPDADVSHLYLGSEHPGGKRGEDYPYRWADGRPFVPAVLYHAAVTGCTWDPFEGEEAVEATLNVGVYWSFWGHVLRACSWPQRYAAGVTVAGASVDTGAGKARAEVVTDPATVLMLETQYGFEGQPVIGQWQPGGDPVAIASAIAAYERRIVAYLGLSPADLHRVSGDPRSGYAIAITREAQRESSRRIEPSFRRGDLQLLSYAAALLNRWAEGRDENGQPLRPLPELGWRIDYEGIPLSIEERRALREEAADLLARGMIDEAGYLSRVEGLSREEALRQIAAVRAARDTDDPDPGAIPDDEDGSDG